MTNRYRVMDADFGDKKAGGLAPFLLAKLVSDTHAIARLHFVYHYGMKVTNY